MEEVKWAPINFTGETVPPGTTNIEVTEPVANEVLRRLEARLDALEDERG